MTSEDGLQDAIIVSSGAGGLCAAAAVSRTGAGVLVLDEEGTGVAPEGIMPTGASGEPRPAAA